MNTTAQTVRTISNKANAFDPTDNTQTEARLLERCKSGDMAAWDALYRKYAKKITGYAYSLCHNYDDANEIASQAFVLVFQNLSGYRKEASIRSWLFAIVRNTFVDLCVRPARLRSETLFSNNSAKYNGDEFAISNLEDPVPSPEQLCIQHETAQIIARAVRYLPSYQRQIVQLRYFDGKTYEEISTALHISMGTVKSRLNRAKNMLRLRMSAGPGSSQPS